MIASYLGQEDTTQDAQKGRPHRAWLAGLIWLIWFVSFIKVLLLNQTKETNSIHHITVFFRWWTFLAACRSRAASVKCFQLAIGLGDDRKLFHHVSQSCAWDGVIALIIPEPCVDAVSDTAKTAGRLS